MGLRARILIGYAAMVALMVVLVAWAIARLVVLGRASDAILSENYRSIVAAERMLDALVEQVGGARLVLGGDIDTGVNRLNEADAAFRDHLATARENLTIPGEDEIVHALVVGYDAYRLRVDRWVASLAEPGATREPEEAATDMDVWLDPVRDAAMELRDLNEQVMYVASASANQEAATSIRSMAMFAAVALVLGVATSVVLADRAVRPVREIAEAAKRIAAGEFGVAVPVGTRDDVGRLATEFNAMAREVAHYHELHVDEILATQSELEAVVAAIDDGLVVFDRQLRVTHVNPAARRLLDLDPDVDGLHTCSGILPFPDVCDRIRDAVVNGTVADVPDDERVVVVATRAGHKHCELAVTPIAGSEGRTTGAVLLLRDLSALVDVERLKSEFVTAASHELRSPLTGLRLSVDLLLERVADGLEPRDRALLDAAHEEVQRLQQLIDHLLDLSRMEAGRIELAFTDVPVIALFDHVATIFEHQLAEKEITLVVEPPVDRPAVRVDATKATWVLTNLVSNALRYVEPGGHIGLSARPAGRFVRFAVSDDGPGIPPEVRERIFQKFVQANGRPGGGSGLGLAVCMEIVRAHGGTIWVESSSGRGSTFAFTLPAAT